MSDAPLRTPICSGSRCALVGETPVDHGSLLLLPLSTPDGWVLGNIKKKMLKN